MDKLEDFANRAGAYWWRQARAIWGDRVGEYPPIIINNRLTSTAGRAFLEEGKIDLSRYLMERNMLTFRDEIIPHEIAHIIAWRIYRDKGHGRHWKHVAFALYGKNDTYHSMVTKYQAQKA